MDILYCGDNNICDGVLISILSLLKHTRSPLTVHLMTSAYKNSKKEFKPIRPQTADWFNSLLQERSPGSWVKLYDVTRQFCEDGPTANSGSMYTPLCMLRLYADLIDDLPKKVLYLDNDVVCLDDPEELFVTDIEDYDFAGVYDYYGRWWVHNPRRFFAFDYMNSGVLLLNLERIRNNGLFERARRRCATKHMMMPDQTSLNFLSDARKVLPRKYNDQHDIHPDTVFRHFSTVFRFVPVFHPQKIKPWDIEKVHSILKINQIDDILAQYLELKPQMP